MITNRDALERDLLDGTELLIDGAWIPRAEGGELEHVDPTLGRAHASFPSAGASETDAAVTGARRALPSWRRMPADVRRSLLLRIAAAIRDRQTEFDLIAALEYGQPLGVGSRAAVCADYFEYYAGWTDKITGDVVPAYPARALDYTLPEPYGVIAAFVNWNGPITAIGRKVAPALAAGNTIVLKASEYAPFTPHRFARLCEECELPAGVVNFVVGGPEAGHALASHPNVDKISFTGGGETAKLVMATAAKQLTPLVLELGGKSANIVFADAEVDRAATFAASFGVAANAGQGCLLPTRLLVHSDIYDALVSGVAEHLASLKIGDPLDKST